MTPTRILLASLFVVLGLSASSAAAQDPVATVDAAPVSSSAYPLPNTERPLTLSRGLLRGDVNFPISHASFGMASDTGFALTLGAGYGITDDLEVGATVIPLILSPEVDFGDPVLYGVFRFVQGQTEVGARASISIPIHDLNVTLGVPVRLHISPAMTLDTGAFLNITKPEIGDTYAGMNIPLTLTGQLTPSLFAFLSTGLGIRTFDAAGDNIFIPLGFGAGYTIPSQTTGGPLADLYASFTFPFFIQSGGGDTIVTQLWTINLGARAYIQVM